MGDELAVDDVPGVIERYLRAHDRRDTDTAIATFRSDAVVIDDGHTYAGTDEIRSWLDHAAAEFTYTRTFTGVEADGDGLVVHNHLEGNFPGGQVDLRYRFELDGDLITRLEIAP